MRATGAIHVKNGPVEIHLGPPPMPAREEKAQFVDDRVPVNAERPTRRNPLLNHPSLK